MIENKEIEEKKDAVLQQICDLLEKLEWGAGRDRLVIRMQFEGRFNLKSFHINGKESSV